MSWPGCANWHTTSTNGPGHCRGAHDVGGETRMETLAYLSSGIRHTHGGRASSQHISIMSARQNQPLAVRARGRSGEALEPGQAGHAVELRQLEGERKVQAEGVGAEYDRGDQGEHGRGRSCEGGTFVCTYIYIVSYHTNILL